MLENDKVRDHADIPIKRVSDASVQLDSTDGAWLVTLMNGDAKLVGKQPDDCA